MLPQLGPAPVLSPGAWLSPPLDAPGASSWAPAGRVTRSGTALAAEGLNTRHGQPPPRCALRAHQQPSERPIASETAKDTRYPRSGGPRPFLQASTTLFGSDPESIPRVLRDHSVLHV